MSEEMDPHGDMMIPRLPVNKESYAFNDWQIVYTKSHILKSMCTNHGACKINEPNCCDLCRFEQTLELPHLPEMVFDKNQLTLTHASGARIEFNALDALKNVKNCQQQLQVACATAWKQSRQNEVKLDEIKPYDWSFATDYQGTFNDKVRCEDTDEKIDIFKLMRKERILFYHELTLFEDELHDHGIATCSVKIRVMPSGFYVLLNYFLRVDGVVIRMNGTRYHFEVGKNFILKEFTAREAHFDKIRHLPPAIYTVPAEIEKHLSVTLKTCQKVFFDSDSNEE